MTESEKASVEKNLKSIINGKFDENNISSFLMSLRELSKKNTNFREIADFIAHSNKRDQGIVQEYLKYKFYFFKYYYSYIMQNKSINLNKPVPKYLKSLFIHQIKELEEKEITRITQSSRKDIIADIEATLINNDEKTVYVKNNIREDTLKIISKAMSYLTVQNSLSLDEFFNETIQLLRTNNISIDENMFEDQRNNFTLCILYKLHDVPIKLGPEEFGRCFIDIDRNYMNSENQFLGRLTLRGLIKIVDKINPIVFDIIQTNLLAHDYCSHDILKLNIQKHSNFTRHSYIFSIEKPIVLTDKFKIEYKK